jgi:hypothetical protein
MTNRDRIVTLLEHYQAVCEGIPNGNEPGDDDGVLALMCVEWNHDSYQRLERLLAIMQQRWPKMRQALRERYERYSERRVAYCPVCKQIDDARFIGEPHLRGTVAGAKLLCRTGAKAPDMIPRIHRVESRRFGYLLADAIDWLERSWGGDVELPATLIGYGRDHVVRAA